MGMVLGPCVEIGEVLGWEAFILGTSHLISL